MKRFAWLMFLVLWSPAILLAQGTLPVQLRSAPGQPMIEGQVLLPNGKPAPAVHLRLEPENSGGRPESTITDSGGHYSFPGNFVAGAWVIIVDAPDFQTIRRHIVAPSHTIEEDFALKPLPIAKEKR